MSRKSCDARPAVAAGARHADAGAEGGGGVPVGAEDAERAAELGFESQRTGW